MKRLILVMVMVMMTSPVLGEGDGDPPVYEPPNWTITVDNKFPFLGDPVVIEIGSLFVGEYATIEIFMEGERVQQLTIRTNSTRGMMVLWETRLDMVPGPYRVSVIHYGKEEANITITLVYDPIDYALKSIILLEQDIDRLDREDQLAEGWAQLALAQNKYEARWRIFFALTSLMALIVIVYLGPPAWFKYVEGGIKRGKKDWEQFKSHVDGMLIWSYGKETMETTSLPTEPVAGVSAWCEVCQVLVHVTDWRDHPHDLLFASHTLGPVPTRKMRVVKTEVD